MTGHEKECALAALAVLIERAKRIGGRELAELRRVYRQIAETKCETLGGVMADMAVPTIHLNGTSQAALVDQLLDARIALNTALTRMRAAAPHGRDYYTQGDTAYAVARAQHVDRLVRVQAVLDEIEALAEAVHQGGHKVAA